MIDSSLVARFAADLDAVVAPGEAIGVAVSGGADSLALLLLAVAARPGQVRAASVDHALRETSRAECETVAAWCADRGVPHDILTIAWAEPPSHALQERARDARYSLLGDWALANGLIAVATGHHRDDQAETLWMRLMRGAGVRGLAGMRASAPLPGGAAVRLVRPLLTWRRDELQRIVAAEGMAPFDDPSNHDRRHERVRVRSWLAGQAEIDPAMLAASAGHLAAADEAVEWAVNQAIAHVREEAGALRFDPGDAPREIRRRVAARLVARLAHEGDGSALRGRELDTLVAALEAGGTATLRGVVAKGGTAWRLSTAPARR